MAKEKLTGREREVRKAMKVISRERLTAFLRAVRETDDLSCKILAVRLANEHLDGGRSLDELFFDGDDFGFSLSVKQSGADTYKIEFGCQVGGETGDGGKWSVTFDGEQTFAQGTEFWIS